MFHKCINLVCQTNEDYAPETAEGRGSGLCAGVFGRFGGFRSEIR